MRDRTDRFDPRGAHAVPSDYFDFVHRITGSEPFTGELRFLNKLVHPYEVSPFERTLFLASLDRELSAWREPTPPR